MAWGWPARSRWLALPPEGRKKHAYLERFKLALSSDDSNPLLLPPGLEAVQVSSTQHAASKK